MPILFYIFFWFYYKAYIRILNFVKFSLGIYPYLLGKLKDRGEPTFFLVAIKFLLRFSFRSLEEFTLPIVEDATLDSC